MKQLSLLMLVLVALIAAKCQDHQNPLPEQKVEATLSGSNEVPPNQSAAKGTFSGHFDPNTNKLKLAVNFSGLTPVAGHIHRGAAGTNGPVIIPFPSVSTSPILLEVTLTDAQVTDLKNGLHYVNLHTPMYPGGEIRGQLAIVP